MRVVYRTRMFKSLSLGKKWHQAEIGLRRLGTPSEWRTLKHKWDQKTKAEDYSRKVMDRFSTLKSIASLRSRMRARIIFAKSQESRWTLLVQSFHILWMAILRSEPVAEVYEEEE